MSVDYTYDGTVAQLHLARPERLNAVVPALTDALAAGLRRAETDGARAVVLAGRGRAFCAGHDLKEPEPVETVLETRARLEAIQDVTRLVRRFPGPVVAAVHGYALGAGAEFALACDVVVAAEDAAFALGYAAIGLAIDGANSWYLPRVVGMRRAQEMFLLNRRLDGREALAWGLVTEVLPADEVEARARALADRLAVGPTAAFGQMRRLLRQSWQTELSEQLVAETDEMSRAGTTADAGEGIRAFVAKRRPEFHGR